MLVTCLGPSGDLGDHDDWDRTSPVCCRLGIHGWNGRCVWLGWGLMVNPGASFDVIAISRADGLGDIANLDLTLADENDDVNISVMLQLV